tara:strand:+ start:361 stop:1644 length:1284 start_codon:yes stop_codon:yes gene_type:complete
MAINNFSLLQPNQPLTQADKLIADINNFNNTVMPNLPPPPPVNVPKYTKFGDNLATLGGFGDQPNELLAQEQLAKMTQDQVDAYNQQRKKARTQGIGELLMRFGDALQGKNASQLAYGRQQVRDLGDAKAAYQQAINIAEASGDFRKANLLRSLGLPGFQQLQQKKAIAELGVGNKLTADQQNYNLVKEQGYPGTFMDYLNEKKSPLVNIADKNESEFQKQAAASGFKIINETTKQVNDFVDIENRLGILQKQLQGGNLETGIFEEMQIPFKRLAAGLNILPQEELDKLDAQELFQRTVNFIVPRLRVSGSGSTSDTEVQLFRESAPALSLTQGGNLLIVGGMSAIAKHNRERLKLMNSYIKKNKNLLGFGEYADSILGSVFKTYDSNESFDKQVKEGKLKAGDFVFDGIYGDFRILTEDDVKGIKM